MFYDITFAITLIYLASALVSWYWMHNTFNVDVFLAFIAVIIFSFGYHNLKMENETLKMKNATLYEELVISENDTKDFEAKYLLADERLRFITESSEFSSWVKELRERHSQIIVEMQNKQ